MIISRPCSESPSTMNSLVVRFSVEAGSLFLEKGFQLSPRNSETLEPPIKSSQRWRTAEQIRAPYKIVKIIIKYIYRCFIITFLKFSGWSFYLLLVFFFFSNKFENLFIFMYHFCMLLCFSSIRIYLIINSCFFLFFFSKNSYQIR